MKVVVCVALLLMLPISRAAERSPIETAIGPGAYETLLSATLRNAVVETLRKSRFYLYCPEKKVFILIGFGGEGPESEAGFLASCSPSAQQAVTSITRENILERLVPLAVDRAVATARAPSPQFVATANAMEQPAPTGPSVQLQAGTPILVPLLAGTPAAAQPQTAPQPKSSPTPVLLGTAPGVPTLNSSYEPSTDPIYSELIGDAIEYGLEKLLDFAKLPNGALIFVNILISPPHELVNTRTEMQQLFLNQQIIELERQNAALRAVRASGGFDRVRGDADKGGRGVGSQAPGAAPSNGPSGGPASHSDHAAPTAPAGPAHEAPAKDKDASPASSKDGPALAHPS